ncbi:MAG TPA: GGDEF domain-containing protein [Steroidobacteraceae bacterium]|nr:GGDEF domain-containing protein [Steroidobacteraceae bacterium]
MVAGRSSPKLARTELAHGIPIFLDQVAKTLAIEQAFPVVKGEVASNNPRRVESGVGAIATQHGRDLFEQGFSVEQVIRDYGDVCQAVTGLAIEIGAPISTNEFRTFNRCLDDAIAGAVSEYSQLKDTRTTANDTATINSEGGTEDPRQLKIELTESRTALADATAALSTAQQHTREAQVRALHDSLTGLPNRELFDDRLAHAIALADRHDWTLAVMFLDLDQFKNLNDSHGHTAGDTALKTIAERLLQYVRDEDTVCRNGGDEFLYLLMNPRGKKNIEQIASSVLRTIAQSVPLDDLELTIKASIGIAIYPEHGVNGEQLIENADAAMYLAKQLSRGVAFFDPQEMHTTTG